MPKNVLLLCLVSFLLASCASTARYSSDPQAARADNSAKTSQNLSPKQSRSNPLFVTESDDYHIARRGDNLTQISRVTGVSVKKLKLYNNLIDDEIFLGQKIYLKPNLNVYHKYITRSEIPPEKYHIASYGQSLADISHMYGVFILDLVDFNGLNGVEIKQGQKVWLVEGKLKPKSSLSTKKVTVSRPQRKKTTVVASSPRVSRATKTATSAKGGTVVRAAKSAIATPKRVRVAAAKTITQAKPQHSDLKLPVKSGRIISNFGKQGLTINKGVNIAGKEGDAVLAALGGKVIFAGEQRGYGNVIVVEHDKFAMTVYAHNKVNLVRSGDKVSAGQPIAKLGKTGRVDSPQLHFEYRVKGKAVDPRKVLGKK